MTNTVKSAKVFNLLGQVKTTTTIDTINIKGSTLEDTDGTGRFMVFSDKVKANLVV